MESGSKFYSDDDEFRLDSKWLIDPQHLFVGPKLGEGAHAKFIGACKEPVMVIVTELLSGGTLRKYLVNARPRCLDPRVAIGFALDIARAMECLHAHGIIHRDLKPENLLLTADHKTVKLADFGLAREESLTEMMTAETGTYRWMAPELYSTVTLRQGEKKHYNHKVDAYSFAIVLWELLHNKLPFEGMSNLQAAYAAAFKNVRPSAENVPEEMATILTSCWKEDANGRPNFTQIIQMLLNYLYTISPPEPMIPPRIYTSENVVLPPESPGTSSLMALRDSSGETPRAKLEDDRKDCSQRLSIAFCDYLTCPGKEQCICLYMYKSKVMLTELANDSKALMELANDGKARHIIFSFFTLYIFVLNLLDRFRIVTLQLVRNLLGHANN
ncbi:hypothetical protein ACFE04_027063 [Oxalis oulophora]